MKGNKDSAQDLKIDTAIDSEQLFPLERTLFWLTKDVITIT